MELGKIFNNLRFEEGIYYNDIKNSISYPEEGNEVCFQIENNSYWFNHRNDCIIPLVKRYAVTNDFWDIGGGNGFVCQRIQKEGFSTVLVEPGINGAQNARSRGVEYVVCSTLDDIAWQEPFMSNVGLFDVVEHIEDDLTFLRSVKEKMQKNGLLFLTVPAYNCLWSNEDVDAGHYRRYTCASISNVLKNAGFKTIFSSYLFWPLPFPIFLKRTISSLLNKQRNKSEGKAYGDHDSSGLLGGLLIKALRNEQRLIAKGKRLGFGSSCLIVAHKIEKK